MKKLFGKEVIIGLCVLIAMLVLFFGINYLKGINLFHSSNYYYATYTNVNGLALSAPVTVNGFKVGQVREIEYQYDNPGHVLVELSLDKNLKVPKNTKAVLASDLLGTATIRLEMSNHPDYHNVGDQLIAVNELSLMDNLSGAAGDVMPQVGSIIGRVDTLLCTLNVLMGDPAIAATVSRLDVITGNLEAGTRSLNSSLAALPPIMGDVKQLGTNTVQMTGRMNQMLDEIHHTYKNAQLDSTLYNIYALTENLKQLTNQLNDPNSTLGKLMSDPALYNSVNTLVSDLDSVVVDLKRQPKRYIPGIKVF